jgi:hypothetical protein
VFNYHVDLYAFDRSALGPNDEMLDNGFLTNLVSPFCITQANESIATKVVGRAATGDIFATVIAHRALNVDAAKVKAKAVGIKGELGQ